MKSKIIKFHDTFHFQVDDTVLDSLAFKSFRPTVKNVQDFYKAGVRLFHVYVSGLPSGLKAPYSLFGETWFGDHKYDWTNLDKQIEFFKENAPEGYLFINIHLDVRDWWLKENPGNPNSFTHLSQIACNDKWKKDTADYLKALIKHTEEKYNDLVIGYFLLGGYTTEWFSQFDNEEENPYKLEAYRKYMNDDNITIPGKDKLEQPKEEILLRGNKEEVINYRKFHNKVVSDLVLYLCHEAQSILNHNKILGLFFGYILELVNDRMWYAGHIEFDDINHSNDIDLLATPSSYQFRAFDQTGGYMLLADTLELNNKACFVSFDHTTFLVPDLPNNKERLCDDPETEVALSLLAEMRRANKKDLLQTREQTIQAMRREFMQRIYKRFGYWWFDMLEGWFYDDGLMNEIKHEVEISKRIMNIDKKSNSEVAVFFSGQSLYYMNKMSEINTETICTQRDGLGRMGAPYDSFSLGDINKVNFNQYKLFIFVESLLLSDEQREIINKLKASDKTVLFIGPVDYAKDGIKSVEEMVNMKLGIQDGLENTVVCEDTKYGYYNLKKDNFYVDDDSIVLGRYESSKKPALCRKNNIFFTGIGNLDYKTLQTILRFAGVHIYTTIGEGTYICENFIGVHAPLHKEVTINLKEDGEYEEIFTGIRYISKDHKITLDTSSNCAQMLRKL